MEIAREDCKQDCAMADMECGRCILNHEDEDCRIKGTSKDKAARMTVGLYSFRCLKLKDC